MNSKRRVNRNRWGAACAAAVSALMFAGALAPANATEANVDSGFTVDLQFEAKEFRTSEGALLRTLSDDNQAGERIVTVVTANGEPARLVFQSVPKASLSEDLSSNSREPVDYSSSTTDPGMITEEIQSTLISDDPSLWTPSFAFAVTRTSASFTWPLNSGEFQISVDGKPAGSSKDSALEITGLTPGTQYSVEIYGEIAGQDSALVPVQKTLNLETASEAAVGPQKELYSNKTFQPHSTAFMHVTFIPDSSAPANLCTGLAGSTFSGDNRSWYFPTSQAPNHTPNYRTMMWANINWGNPEPYRVITQKKVGQTKLYIDGAFDSAAYANTNQMLFQDAYSSGAYAQVRFNHTGTNPFCSAGSIQYNEIVRFYQSGTVEIVGWRKPVPAHEGYIRFNGGTGGNAEIWTNAFKRTNEGFHCLVSLCTNDPINIAKSY